VERPGPTSDQPQAFQFQALHKVTAALPQPSGGQRLNLKAAHKRPAEMDRLPRIFIDVPALRAGTAGAYAFAVLMAGIGLVVRLAIDPYVTGIHYVTFFPVVIVTTLISGLGAGLFCLALSVGAASFFLMPPRFSFHIESMSDLLTTLLFVLLTLSIVILLAGMRFAIERYLELSQKLEQHEIALREREDRLAVMVAELQHRTRNLISVVGAIADDALRTSDTLDDFKVKYHERLDVLGRAQGLLFRKDGGRVTFDELLDNELAAQSIRVGNGGSVTLDGPKGVRLRSGTVQTLAMVLHELVTNAVKYGALKQPNGHLTIRWHQAVSVETGKPLLHIDWKEHGVDVPADAGSGRGRELIERALPYQFGAQATFALEADGVHCTISLPASEHVAG
jgi:two-component sensor histidine kinase